MASRNTHYMMIYVQLQILLSFLFVKGTFFAMFCQWVIFFLKRCFTNKCWVRFMSLNAVFTVKCGEWPSQIGDPNFSNFCLKILQVLFGHLIVEEWSIQGLLNCVPLVSSHHQAVLHCCLLFAMWCRKQYTAILLYLSQLILLFHKYIEVKLYNI